MNSKSYQKAWGTALDLLSRRNHSASELRTKLKQRGFSRDEIEAVLKRCERDNYIDDDATAGMWIRACIRKGHGPYRIRRELKQKGLPPEAFDTYMIETPDAPKPDETARLALLRKRNAFLRETNLQRRRQKMSRFLYNRGFSSETISRAVKTVNLLSTE